MNVTSISNSKCFSQTFNLEAWIDFGMGVNRWQPAYPQKLGLASSLQIMDVWENDNVCAYRFTCLF